MSFHKPPKAKGLYMYTLATGNPPHFVSPLAFLLIFY